MLFDALLVHGYWLSQKGENPVEISLRSKLAVYATYLLYRNKQVKNIFLPAGHIWGKNFPSIAQLMEEELVKKYDVPKDNIIVSDEGLNTRSEITAFLKIAENKDWKSLGDLSFEAHHLTIPIHYQRLKKKAKFINVEDVIAQEGDSKNQKVLKWLKNSRFEFNFRLYQTLVKVVQFFDPDYKLLGGIADKTRDKKSHNSPLSFMAIDVYDL